MQASVAKLETYVNYVGDMLELKVYGFNEKLPVLLSKFFSVAKSFVPTDDRFKVCNMLLFIFIFFSVNHILIFLHSVFACHEPLII